MVNGDCRNWRRAIETPSTVALSQELVLVLVRWSASSSRYPTNFSMNFLLLCIQSSCLRLT